MLMAAVPARVDADTKQVLLESIAHATDQGWPLVKACAVLGLEERRARRWMGRKDAGTSLVDARPGGVVNALTSAETGAILGAFTPSGRKTSPTVAWPTGLLRAPVLGRPVHVPPGPKRPRPAVSSPATPAPG